MMAPTSNPAAFNDTSGPLFPKRTLGGTKPSKNAVEGTQTTGLDYGPTECSTGGTTLGALGI